MKVYVDRKIIGDIDARTFTKRVKGSKHMLRQPPAWGIDAPIFDEQIKPNCDTIVVIDMETDKKYQVSVELFNKQKGTLDRGFGKQYYLTLKWWNSEKSRAQMAMGL